jgi:iron complex outermembrane recepter protein
MTRLITSSFFLLLVTLSTAFGQSASVRGSVQTPNRQPVLFATVALLNGSDSSLAKAGITTETGQFVFTNLRAGTYRVGVSAVGVGNQTTASFTITDGQTFVNEPITVQETAKTLSTVTIKARKPLIEVLPDKLVFNVENSLNATGSTALELLQKSPGVVIDRNDNVLLKGSAGVRIFINGKPSPLDAGELAAYLRTLQSTDIEAIEIITQPSARYDAAGGVGIINIRLKKNRNFGTNGSATVGLAQGIYYPKFTGSLSVNQRTQKTNVFANYSNRTTRDWSFINFYREQLGMFYDQKSETRSQRYSHNMRAGADWFVNTRSTIGVLIDGNLGTGSASTLGRTPIGLVGQPVTQLLTANNKNTSARHNLNANLNYRYADTLGRVFNIDVDYGNYASDGSQFQPNRYSNPTENITLSQRDYRMNTLTNIRLATIKADYEQRLRGGTFSTGLKLSDVRTDNDFQFFDVQDGTDRLNANRTNRFVYTERINAAYASYQKKTGKWQYQAGLRIEQTKSEGDLSSAVTQADALVKRNYINAFPSAGLTYTPNDKNNFGLTYSRRIDRPTYRNLNPFESKSDELTYQKGNAFLRPQYTDNVQLSHTFKYTLNTSLGYSATRDYFTDITDTTEVNRNYITMRNLSSQNTLTLSVSYPFQIAKWWNVYANVSAYHSVNRADFGAGRQIRLAADVVSVYAQQTFTLPYGITAEVSGFYNSPSVWGGTFLNRRFWGMDAGLQRKFFNDRATLKLTMSDVFQSMQWRGISQFGGLYMDASGGWESRQVRANFTWVLGNKQVKAARQRSTGAGDESDRAK